MTDLESFKVTLRKNVHEIGHLEAFTITDCGATLSRSAFPKVIEIILRKLDINDNDSKVVSGTKTLHHLLPDLVPPMDREYTGRFFCWHAPYFQNKQADILDEGLRFFNECAREAKPQSYIGPGWRTSQTKVLDNAIIGYCLLENVPHPS